MLGPYFGRIILLVVRKFTLIVFRSAATHVDFVFAIFYVINLLYNFGTCKNNSLTNSRGETEYKIVIDGKYRSVYVCWWWFDFKIRRECKEGLDC